MNKVISGLTLSTVLIASSAFAATRSYQVTGPVLESNDKVIVIQKGNDRWELERTPGTKISGNLKTGEKVTISYSMVASDIEVKPAESTKATKHKK